jgi:hypothetical protein
MFLQDINASTIVTLVSKKKIWPEFKKAFTNVGGIEVGTSHTFSNAFFCF